MDNRDQTAWQVQFPEPGLAGFANDMAQALREGGVDGVGAPVLVPPKVSQYNAATVLLMIAATSIGKAAVVYGLRALEKMIAERLDRGRRKHPEDRGQGRDRPADAVCLQPQKHRPR